MTKAQIEEAHSLDARFAAADVDEPVVGVPVLEAPSQPAAQAEAIAVTTTTSRP
jgi:hypothetical protein